MAVNANTVETYDNLVMREDLEEQYYMISPEECPFTQLAGRGTADATFHEWPIVQLAAPDGANRVVEGDDDPAIDPGTLPNRIGNYCQISDKTAKVSSTSEAVDSAAENIQKLTKQVALKLREIKRDMEVMLLQNIAADAGSSGNARVSAGLPAFLRTNTYGEAGGADPTLSGTLNGFPDAPATGGTTPVPMTEAVFKSIIQACWESGGNPTIAMVNANNKTVISETFTGATTRYKDAIDKTLVAAIDIYDSDFGRLSVVPNRFQPTIAANNYAVYILDPDYVELAWLDSMKQKPLAETGHSHSRLVWGEYTLVVGNEAAHGVIRDTTGAAAP